MQTNIDDDFGPLVRAFADYREFLQVAALKRFKAAGVMLQARAGVCR